MTSTSQRCTAQQLIPTDSWVSRMTTVDTFPQAAASVHAPSHGTAFEQHLETDGITTPVAQLGCAGAGAAEKLDSVLSKADSSFLSWCASVSP